IADFLESHLHPAMLKTHSIHAKNKKYLPNNVAEQIYLWEKEDKIFDIKRVALYTNFEEPTKYHKVKNFSVEKGKLIAYSDEDMYLIVYSEIHDEIKILLAKV
ncbi:MAG: General transcription factor IIH subunit 4, partial [Paramarteilia canceri]